MDSSKVIFSGFSIPFFEIWELMIPEIRDEIISQDLDLDNQAFLYLYLFMHYLKSGDTFDEEIYYVPESDGDGFIH